MAQREALVAMESERARRLSLDKEAESQLALLRSVSQREALTAMEGERVRRLSSVSSPDEVARSEEEERREQRKKVRPCPSPPSPLAPAPDARLTSPLPPPPHQTTRHPQATDEAEKERARRVSTQNSATDQRPPALSGKAARYYYGTEEGANGARGGALRWLPRMAICIAFLALILGGIGYAGVLPPPRDAGYELLKDKHECGGAEEVDLGDAETAAECAAACANTIGCEYFAWRPDLKSCRWETQCVNADGSPNYQRSGGTLQGAGFSVYRLNPPTDSSARQLYDELASSAVDMYGKVRSGAVKLNEKLG